MEWDLSAFFPGLLAFAIPTHEIAEILARVRERPLRNAPLDMLQELVRQFKTEVGHIRSMMRS